MSGPEHLGISRKLFIAFTIVAIIPLMVALIVSVSVLLGQAESVASEVLWGKLRLAQLNFDGKRDNMARTLDTATRNTGILVNMELSLDYAVSGTLAEINADQNLDGLWVCTPVGKLFASADGRFPFGIDGHNLPTGEETFFSIYEREDGPAFLQGTKRLVSGNGDTIAFLRAAIDLKRFCAEASASINSPVFLILDSGRKILESDSDKTRNHIFVLEAGTSRPEPSAMQEKSTARIDGVPYLVSVVPVADGRGYSMRLGVAYPESLVSGSRNRQILILEVSGAFAVVLAFLGGVYFRRSIIVPVLAVAKAARVIADGVYGNTVDIDTHDEIGALARDFNRMSERLYTQGKEREAAERVIEESLGEKETLLREIHHRVKNNFQIINSLFDLQMMNTKDVAVQESLNEPKARIHAMALIHDRLYQSDSFSSIDFGDYVGELAQDLFYSYNMDPSRITLDIIADSVSLDMDRAIPCGLMLNELVTNSLKYAFPDTAKKGKITVSLKKSASTITLCVMDDGKGFSPDVLSRSQGTLGFTLVKILCEQIKASFKLKTEVGVTATICF